MEAYGASCAVTGCRVVEVLEAAHLRPYRGPDSNVIANGLLLRADLHTLLDLGLVAFEPDSRTVRISAILRATEYELINGRPLAEPNTSAGRPSKDVLISLWHYFEMVEADRVRAIRQAS